MDNIQPWMSAAEVELIVSTLQYNDTMLEWGSGGSTLLFPKYVSKYYSIEHNKEWADRIVPNVASNVMYKHIPQDAERTLPTQRSQFSTYIEYIDNFNFNKIDKVLIDGRGRGWCAEYVLPYLHEDSIVFIHDFWQRPNYHIVLNWYTEFKSIRSGQSLVALKPRKEFIK